MFDLIRESERKAQHCRTVVCMQAIDKASRPHTPARFGGVRYIGAGSDSYCRPFREERKEYHEVQS